MSKQDIEKRLGFAAQGVKAEIAALPGVKAEMAAPANWEAKLDAKNLADGFNVEGLRELLGAAKEIARKYPQYKALGQKLVDGINMVVSAVKQMKTESMKAARPGVKAKMAADWKIGDAVHLGMGTVGGVGYNGIITKLDGDTVYIESTETDNKYGPRTFKGLVRYLSRNSRLGVKAKMALTIYTVGAKNACYEALANLKALAQLASETKSGWDFHVTAIIDHVKSAMSQLESSPAQAGTHLERAINTLGMLRKIDPVRLNDNQKGSLKQLIGYVAKSLRDARANIKVVTTASRPGAKKKMSKATDALAFIKSSIESGKTVYIQTPRGATKVTPKTYAKFESLGRPLFKIGTDGALLMSSGNSYNRLTMGEDEMLVRVSAMSRPGAKAKA